jgi:DNA-binding Lrp family transcriptional regulator
MPVKGDIKDEALLLQEQVWKACKGGARTMLEIAEVTGFTPNSMRYAMRKLIEARHIRRSSSKFNPNGNECYRYVPTDFDFVKPKIGAPVKILPAETPSYMRIVTCNDYHPTRLAPRRIDARIGSTFSTMSF